MEDLCQQRGKWGQAWSHPRVKLQKLANYHVLYCKWERLWIIYGVKPLLLSPFAMLNMHVSAMNLPSPVL